MRNPRRRIIFIVSSDAIRQFVYGNHRIDVDMPGAAEPALPNAHEFDADPMIKDMIKDILFHKFSLRRLFDNAFSRKFTGGGNWCEVDNIIGMATIRFPPCMEGIKCRPANAADKGVIECDRNDMRVIAEQKFAQGAPGEVLVALGLAEHRAAENMRAYGWERCVNALDQM
ncbi:hypothetical protein LSTR_LSTR017635 [Laodelphax striatellus]|uniref:Uncharacterized protein n=1 Tax=Laodelphax striatellus TaxID=195883 RepID=A0A482XQ88_LAOST|nr:hypothetical protein LSTR_LSTR017635 [Laodelphax striatellus]